MPKGGFSPRNLLSLGFRAEKQIRRFASARALGARAQDERIDLFCGLISQLPGNAINWLEKMTNYAISSLLSPSAKLF
jgi:hypothetical protein